MPNDPLNRLPPARRAGARKAIAAVGGARAIDRIEPMAGAGVSAALIYRLEVGGRSYVLRLDPLGRGACAPAYGCMRIAAEAGIAPRLYYADDGECLAIMDFVAGLPLARFPGGAPALAAALGELLGRLQDLRGFAPRGAYGEFLRGQFARVIGSCLFAPGLLEPHRLGFERIARAYPWDGEPAVACHADLNPANILFDGARLWLIDWETAGADDAMIDAAILTNYLAAAPGLEAALVMAWRGRGPDALLGAKLVLMRQMIRIFYACAALIRRAELPAAAPVTDLSALSPRQFMAAIETGALRWGTAQTLMEGGKCDLARFLAILETPECQNAIGLCRSG